MALRVWWSSASFPRTVSCPLRATPGLSRLGSAPAAPGRVRCATAGPGASAAVSPPVGLGRADPDGPQGPFQHCGRGSRTPTRTCPSSRSDVLHRQQTKMRPFPQPEDASGGSSPSGASKSDANRASSGGGGGGLMEEMNKLLAKRWVPGLPGLGRCPAAPVPRPRMRVRVLACAQGARRPLGPAVQ